MTGSAKHPIWISIAAATLVGHGLAVVLLHPLSVAWLASLAVAVLLAWLLLRASRVAWVIILVSSISQLITPFATDGPLWIVALAAIRIGCLVAPSSRAFVWFERRAKDPEPPRPRLVILGRRMDHLLASLPVYVNTHLTTLRINGREIIKEKAHENRVLGRLTIGIVAVALALTFVYEAQQGFARGSVIVDILGVTIWTAFNLALLTLIVLVSVRLHHYLTTRDRSSRNATK